MTTEEKLNLLKDRYVRLSNNPKDIKAPGVVTKLRRTIRKIESSL